MPRLPVVLRMIVTVVAIAIGVEGGYRLYLYFKHPNYFKTTDIDSAEFSVADVSQWNYDPAYGYNYIPSLKIQFASFKGGVVVGCGQAQSANEQGNFGPPVLDFDSADVKIAIFGDSFLGAQVTGPSWAKMLGEKLESKLHKTVRVMNMGRDGYGLPQMVALANGKLKDLRPALIVFSVQDVSFGRGRSWRTTIGSGDDVRVYTSVENAPYPNPEEAADTTIVVPSVSRIWCENQLQKSLDEQKSDPLLQKIVVKHREIAIRNGSPNADLFDFKTSYVYGLIRYRSPFRSQWRKMMPSTNPEVTYEDYRDDPKFMADIAGVMNSGVPYVFAHLALGTSISEGRESDLDVRSRKLMESLRNVTGAEIYKTTDFISLSREDALRMCLSAIDCHPSEFGHGVYADVVAKMILRSGFR
jgi:hypothetical protein